MRLRLQRWVAFGLLLATLGPPVAAVPWSELRGAPKACAMACSLKDGPCCCQLLGLEGDDVEHPAGDHARPRLDPSQPFLDQPPRGCGPETCRGTAASGTLDLLPLPAPAPTVQVTIRRLGSSGFAPGTIARGPDLRAVAPRGPPAVDS